ncbi:hypothetical protein [Pedobacter mendelii]|nr:hypothetical protein [Pedobacter mendelii]
MMKTNTRKIELNDLLIDGLQAAGGAMGFHASKRRIGGRVAKNIGIVDQLMKFAFTRKGNSPNKLQKDIELGGLGVIAAYNLYKGIKRKRKSLLLQGAFLTVSLAIVVFGTIKKKPAGERPNALNRK